MHDLNSLKTAETEEDYDRKSTIASTLGQTQHASIDNGVLIVSDT